MSLEEKLNPNVGLNEYGSQQDISCRICMEREDELIRPCKCSGSMGVIHRKCLDKWRKTTSLFGNNNERAVRCEICHEYYQFDTEITEIRYNKCRIFTEVFLCFLLLHVSGFVFGIFMTGFGEITTTIAVKHMNIYLYQYIFGNVCIHLLVGLCVVIGIFSSDNGPGSRGICFIFCSMDSGIYFLILAVGAFFIGLLVLTVGIYYLALERIQLRQKLAHDTRRIKDLNSFP